MTAILNTTAYIVVHNFVICTLLVLMLLILFFILAVNMSFIHPINLQRKVITNWQEIIVERDNTTDVFVFCV